MNTALFIDGDNINLNNIKFNQLFKKIKEENNLIIKKVYGDWKLEQMNNFWDKKIIEHGLEEIQITRLGGKNSTDNKIIVDIMDTSFNLGNKIEKFILLGCDKDYIPLIRYITNYGYLFEVFGLKYQTSIAIMNSCSIYNDIEEYINNNNQEYDINNENNENNENKIDNKEDIKLLNNNIYNNESFLLLNEIIYSYNGISISELKREIKNRNKKELFGKEFRNLNIFIKTKFNNYFDVKIKNNKVMIYRKKL